MESATIVVLVITGAFLAFCAWIEWHPRWRLASVARVEPVEVPLIAAEQETSPKNLRQRTVDRVFAHRTRLYS